MKVALGVDPGPSTGISLLSWAPDTGWRVLTYQCSADAAAELLALLLDRYRPNVVAVEEFEVRRGSGGTSGKDAGVTRELRYMAEKSAQVRGITCDVRKPGHVKPWGTDKRLEKIGFPLGPKFKDARDSARHAMYSMVKRSLAPDPMLLQTA